MRAAAKLFAIALSALFSAESLTAQPQESPIPERRLIVEQDVDYFGEDLRALFDTTYDACRLACLTDPACGAFTFNGRSNSCFPKRGVTRRDAYQGATSAVIVAASPAQFEAARVRREELAFLSPADIEAALAEAEALPLRHLAGAWQIDELLRGAQEARDRGEFDAALRWQGAAVVLTDRADHWLDYARSALTATGETDQATRDIRQRALPASVNAYLRATDAALRSDTLLVMAEALEQADRGRDTVPALRLADALAASPAVTEALNSAIGRHGFRITDHQVDSDPAIPRVCATFSEQLARGVDFEPYVQLPGTGFSVDAEDRQLCIEGVEHGQRYQLAFRAGLPAESGEGLVSDVPLTIYVRDRAPGVRFPGRAYVLPRVIDAALPIVTVNLAEVDLALRRVDDRNLMQMIQDHLFGEQLSQWEDRRLESDLAETVWSGVGEVEQVLNTDVTTLLPMADAIGDLPAGLYALQASIRDADPYEVPPATQWFVISDIGLASMGGADGLHVFLRSLASADPLVGVEVSLVSRANRVLATATTDDQGHVQFEPGLVKGRGGAAPALVIARTGDDDMGFLSLTDPEFDLADRGVEGRPAAGPVDVFLATDRGAYRAGETVQATVLARDGDAKAIDRLPLTAILSRPDGVEYSRLVSDGGLAGGHVFSLPLGGTVPRGTWSLAIHGDPQAPALATQTLLVEDFLPERIDFEMVLTGLAPHVDDTPPLRVAARYLFGAPGSDLPVEGEVQLRAVDGLEGFPGYRFGLHDDPFDPRMEVLESTRTDAAGDAVLPVTFPEIGQTSRPLEARVTLRVSEGSGRPVERRLTTPMAPTGPMIGLKPLFDGAVGEGGEAGFEVIGIDENLAPTPMLVTWKLNRLETRYQWYSAYGSWEWEPMTRRERVASGEAEFGSTPVRIAAPVAWGRYELVVERLDGPYTASSVAFDAGWYAPADATASPDLLEVSLDKKSYRPGETAHLRVVPRSAGKALIAVASNRLIDLRTVELPAGESVIDLPVTEAWGAGAYVTATLVRPMSDHTGRAPSRALGLTHAAVDPGPARLQAAFEVPAAAPPRAPLDVVLRVDGVADGETAFATIAAVDQGILNLTGHLPPDAPGHFFGQRKLGMALRDIYGRLIDGRSGNRGLLRSGGDAEAQMRMQSPPPTEELVAFFSGPVEVGADGRARARFDLPAFNGQVSLMAVVWSRSGVGKASAEVLVRDPVVLAASVPRFLAPGDRTEMRLELVHADGPSGDFGLEATASGVALDASAVPPAIPLADGGKAVLTIPVEAVGPGLGEIALAVLTPDGKRLTKTLKLPVQVNDPEVATTTRFPLRAGASFTLSRDVFTGLQPGTGSATLALGPLGTLDAPGLIAALDRYPYGCTEQVTSQALPLLYLDEVARAMGLEERETIAERIGAAVDIVLSRQSGSGGFGLWGAYDSDLWLDAYVTDFLSRVQARGYDVPALAFRQAMDNLRNQLNYAADFDSGGEALAYALLVLAREGAAPIGDLRYYADVKGGDFATPLATAQIGAALAMYGDQPRADAMFRRAAGQLMPQIADEEDPVWRIDYGTHLRDSAAVLTLAVEAGTEAIDRQALVDRLAQTGRSLSTQEAIWSLLAAHALVDAPTGQGFLIDGAPADGPLVRVLEDRTGAAPVVVTNTTDRETQLTLTTFGVPEQAEERRSYGYAIDREYFTMEGAPADPASVARGVRLVTVLTVRPFQPSEARLMVNDPLPAGFEIDNPSLVRSGDIGGLGWLETAETSTSEFRQERFLAAVDWRSDKPFRLAYVVRAVSPGDYHHPAASVEDMYRPQFRGRGVEGRVTVTE